MRGKGLFLLLATFATFGGAAASADASGGARLKRVRYGDYAIKVPAQWPVYRLAAHPSRCVRFDRHAVYLGTPGADQRCPAHVVGHAAAIAVEPLRGASAQAKQPGTVSAAHGKTAPAAFPPASAGEVRLAVPSAGVLVNATWRRDPGQIREILGRARRVRRAAAPPAASAPETRAPVAKRRRGRRQPSSAPYFTGLGFDACAAPSSAAMSAWSASPYHAVGIYIGGANRGCSQPNLTPGWVGGVLGAGWHLMPLYVGLQAPDAGCGCASIRGHRAKAQGRAAARDAVRDARSLGLAAGAPIYFDLEAYPRGGRNSGRVLSFLSGWTSGLHRLGYVSGVYSSAGSGVRDLVSRYGSGYEEPDDIWIANWNGQATTSDPYVPASFWSDHQRIHQYRGAHNERYGGVTINIDNDYLDGAVVGGVDTDGDHVQDAADLCRTIKGPVQNFGCPYPSYMSGELKGYFGFVKGDRRHGDLYATTAGLSAAYRFRAHMGFLLPVGQPGTVPLYSCRSRGDHYLSRDGRCGGHEVLAKLGYLYPSEPDGVATRPVFACHQPDRERFASPDPGCGGPRNTNERTLGFTIAAAPLVSYEGNDARGADSYATTAAVGPAYRFQANLGIVYETSQPGTVPLYSCVAEGDHFLSTASDCGGQQVIARVGYAYSAPPDAVPTTAIYSCQLAGGDVAVSYDPTCGGPPGVNQGSLGFTISILPLGSYYDSVKGDRYRGDRFATTGGVGPAYRFQRNIGFLYQSSQADTTPLYKCRLGRDRFLSATSGCRGGTALGTAGYAYASQPAAPVTHALYACHEPSGNRFTSSSPTCGRPRNTNDGVLGYALVSPLG